MVFEKDFSQLPDSIQNYVKFIVTSELANEIYLFGSRARGDHRENSDFDIAVEWKDSGAKAVLALKAKLEADPITLYSIDLLDLNTATEDYISEIQKEGLLLWRRKA